MSSINFNNDMNHIPVSILSKSIAGRYRPVSYPDGPITARYRFRKNAGWDLAKKGFIAYATSEGPDQPAVSDRIFAV